MKFQITSLGCPKNRVDSEIIASLLYPQNWSSVNLAEEAEVVIVNTCSFIKPAVEESLREIEDLLLLKTKYNFKLIVVGCMVDRFVEDFWKKYKGLDLVISSSLIPDLPRLMHENITGCLKGHKGLIYSSGEHFLSSTYPYSYLKISEGCDNHCSYCTIPYIKGSYRSRKIEEIVKEGEHFLKSGFKELILVSQDSGLYGYDLYGELKLAELLKKISSLPYNFWLRVMYIYPTRITPQLISVLASEKKIVKYLDIPLQHTHDDILKLMGRKYGYSFVKNLIRDLRNAIPEIVMRSTFIVGFPGEKEKHFNFLMNSLKELEIPRVGFFPYYDEEGTESSIYFDKVRSSLLVKRLNEAQNTQVLIREKFNKQQIGRVLEVLVEEAGEEVSGRSYMDAPEVDARVYIKAFKEKPKIGDFTKVQITKFEEVDLKGKIV